MAGGARVGSGGSQSYSYKCAVLGGLASPRVMHRADEQLEKQWPDMALAGGASLDELQPDVLAGVLAALPHRDMAALQQCSRRLRGSTKAACQHWAPRVEAWLAAEPAGTALLSRLRGERPPLAAPRMPRVGSTDSAESMMSVVELQNLEVAPPDQAGAAAQASGGSSSLTLLRPQDTLRPSAAGQPAPPRSLNWRAIWACIERAHRGPWQLDVRALAPASSPHGVLLTFELLLQSPAPPTALAAEQQGGLGWRDSVTVVSFMLDQRAVDIVVDASGRCALCCTALCDCIEWHNPCVPLAASHKGGWVGCVNNTPKSPIPTRNLLASS